MSNCRVAEWRLTVRSHKKNENKSNIVAVRVFILWLAGRLDKCEGEIDLLSRLILMCAVEVEGFACLKLWST